MQKQAEKKVLIIDDDENFLNAMKKILLRAGFFPTEISNPIDAVSLIKKEYFPIIITDLRMPGMDGLELISKIMILSPRSRVILITAFGDNHIREEAFKKGIFDYLTKPVKKEDILAVVGRAVGLYQNC